MTKLVTRVGAKRGAFRTLIQTWDFDGRELKPNWKYVVPPDSGATSFHQIRTVDVDQDGKDDIADGNYVVNSDGTLRYVVDGAGHGDRFHIADLDPARPGPRGSRSSSRNSVSYPASPGTTTTRSPVNDW